MGRYFVKHINSQGQQHNTLGQNSPAAAEPEVGAIKQEEGSRDDVGDQNVFANRMKTSKVGAVSSDANSLHG